jgi:hypothetical protein
MIAPKEKPCVFCPSIRTNKLGEHVFDDWLNRLDGKVIRDKYEFTQRDPNGSAE